MEPDMTKQCMDRLNSRGTRKTFMLKQLLSQVMGGRMYCSDTGILLKLEMIDELRKQIKRDMIDLHNPYTNSPCDWLEE